MLSRSGAVSVLRVVLYALVHPLLHWNIREPQEDVPYLTPCNSSHCTLRRAFPVSRICGIVPVIPQSTHECRGMKGPRDHKPGSCGKNACIARQNGQIGYNSFPRGVS